MLSKITKSYPPITKLNSTKMFLPEAQLIEQLSLNLTVMLQQTEYKHCIVAPLVAT